MKTVTVTVAKDATVKVAIDGVCGPSCSDVVKSIANALGGQVANEEKTPDYYAQEQLQVGVHTGN